MAAFLVATPLAAGGLGLVHTDSAGAFEPTEVEVPFGRVVAGSTLGPNQTDASVSIAGTLLETTTAILYLNNTSATGVHHARLEVVDITGLADIGLLELGIDNGTATDQILISLGSILDADGTYVRLEPASTNTIYVTQSISSLATIGVTFFVYASDDAQESAYVRTQAQLTVT